MLSPALPVHAQTPVQTPDLTALPQHTALAVQTRDGLVESIHYGSVIATAPDESADGGLRTLFSAGDPLAPFYPRSSLKPLQAVAMVSAGLEVPADLLALTAASHSGAAMHRDGALRILEMHGLTADALENSTDLPYGPDEREEWLRNGGTATQLTQNCSGKHAAMAATCVINGWPVRGYLDPGHPLQQLVRTTVRQLTGEEPERTSTDGCGTPLFALTLRGMARAFGRITSAVVNDPEGPEAAVGRAMMQHPEMVAGVGRDVTELMRLAPGASGQGRLRRRAAGGTAGRPRRGSEDFRRRGPRPHAGHRPRAGSARRRHHTARRHRHRRCPRRRTVRGPAAGHRFPVHARQRSPVRTP